MQIDPNAVGASGLNSASPVGGQDVDKTAFLKLLVAQLQHQDPLEPMSTTEFVAQLAQFTSVEQLVGVNEGINMLGIQQMGISNAQAADMIGKEVEIKSDKLTVSSDDDSVGAAFRLDGDAEDVQVRIRDATGTVVRTIDMGPQTKGDISLEWDLRNDNGGMVAPGTYRIDVLAEDADGNSISWETRVRGVVSGISYDNGYPELVVGSIRASMSDIVGVYPGEQGESGGQTNP